MLKSPETAARSVCKAIDFGFAECLRFVDSKLKIQRFFTDD